MTDKQQMLTQLAAIRARRDALNAEELKLVAALRQAAATWREIADELGIEQPNAVRKFRPLLEETRTVRVRKPKEHP